MKDLWSIGTDKHADDKESILRRGNVYQIANGYMGYRGTLDEYGPDQMVGITLAGIFDRVGSKWREPINAPNGGFTSVSVDGIDLTVLQGKVLRHRQRLKFADALFERSTEFQANGNRVTLKSWRFLSAEHPNLGVIKFSIRCEKAAHVAVRTGIDGNIWDLNGPHLVDLIFERRGDSLLVQGRARETAKTVVVAETVDFGGGKVAHECQESRNLRVVSFEAEARKIYTFYKYFAIYTDNDKAGKPVAEAAIQAVQTARIRGYSECLRVHDAEWRRRWKRSDVKIEGDREAQLALRYSILQLLMVAPVKGSANSIPARALSGQCYKGAVFWDTEMFMFPFFVFTHPQTAFELMKYRIETLEGAKRKAKSEGLGHRGAFYAWESQETGDDACTYFNIGDPITGRALRTYFRDKQVHISGDVAIAMWDYFRLTGDDTLLLQGGAEVILECARFYYSIAYYKREKKRYEILDVTGPDEYHERVNNNAFTSMVVRETFSIAGQVVAYLRKRHPDNLRALLRKLRMEKELSAFEDAARKIFVPSADPKTGIIEQFDGYLGLQESSVEKLRSQMIHPNEYLGGGQGLAMPTKIIKQADVVMMLSLFRTRFSAKVKKANWEYYEPRTEHGSSLSACAYAMVATEFGNLDYAYRYFLKTAKIDLEAKYKIYVGNVFMGGSHPAANGGAWMTAVFGFGGVQADEKRLIINPRLFSKWRRLRFNLAYRGDTFHVEIGKKAVILKGARTNRHSRLIRIAGRAVRCKPGEKVKVASPGL